ncbi:MAG: hypothetical protein ACE5PO_01995 [Candidatus Bathyarchaeia archaeon]
MNRWLYLVVCNTPPIDWLGFLGLWNSLFDRLEADVNLDDVPQVSYNWRGKNAANYCSESIRRLAD